MLFRFVFLLFVFKDGKFERTDGIFGNVICLVFRAIWKVDLYAINYVENLIFNFVRIILSKKRIIIE